MKIGIISNLYPPYARGGAEKVVARTVEALIEQGHDVFVISTHPKRLGSTIVPDQNTTEKVYRFFSRNIYHTLDDHKYPWLMRLAWHVIDAFGGSPARRVKQVLEVERPDVVITHNLKGIGLRIPGAIRRLKIPHVHIVHDLQLIVPSGLLYYGYEGTAVRYGFYHVACRFLFGSPSMVIFPSRFLRDQYAKAGFFPQSKIEVMPNPAPQFIPVVRGERLGGPLKLLFVGQLETHKGIDLLLSSLASLPSDTRLIIAGKGTRRTEVERIADENKRVIYLGFISLEQLVSCLGVVDAIVVPSLCYENSPNVIYESLNAGVPVIASNIGGVGELVHEGENGYLFEPGSVTDFARVVHEFDLRKEEFSASQEKIRATVTPYELKEYAKRLVGVISKIINDPIGS